MNIAIAERLIKLEYTIIFVIYNTTKKYIGRKSINPIKEPFKTPCNKNFIDRIFSFQQSILYNDLLNDTIFFELFYIEYLNS